MSHNTWRGHNLISCIPNHILNSRELRTGPGTVPNTQQIFNKPLLNVCLNDCVNHPRWNEQCRTRSALRCLQQWRKLRLLGNLYSRCPSGAWGASPMRPHSALCWLCQACFTLDQGPRTGACRKKALEHPGEAAGLGNNSTISRATCGNSHGASRWGH